MTAHPDRSRVDHVLVVLSSLAIFLIGLVMVGLIATAWWPLGPLSKLELRVVNEPRVNGDIHVQVDYCKDRDISPAEVRWALVDGVTIMLPPYVVTLPLGCHAYVVSLPVARAVMPGIYQLQVTGIYRVWPWRDAVYVVRTPPFRLLPASGP